MKRTVNKVISWMLAASMGLSVTGAAMAENTEAPRAYFPYPAELEQLPDNFSLPDLFKFFDASADPNGTGRVESKEEWAARAAELKDMLSYYVYGNRLDPLKSDTTITKIRENFEYIWADGVMGGPASMFGYNALPNLPEGAVTMVARDFSAWGMGMYYSNITPNDEYVHEGEDYVMPGDLKPWKSGDTWAEHTEVVSKVKLPTLTVEMLIKDTNPANEAYRSAEAAEGVTWTFDIRYPNAPEVDGKVRDAKASRHGTGYPVVVAISGLSEAQQVTLTNNGYVYLQANDACNPDAGQISRYEALYPPQDPIVHNDNTIVNDYAVDSGDLMHSGWIASRALDAIENYMALSDAEKAAINPDVILENVDVYSSAITGCSNNGKRAVIGGIYDTGDNGDTRFDIIAPSDSGGGGLSGFRYLSEGQLFSYEAPVTNGAGGVVVHDYPYGLNEHLARAVQNVDEDQWFADRAQIFTVRPDLADNTPVDLHALPAIFATTKEDRYFITWTAEAQDAWNDTPATVLDMMAAKEVYEYLGQGNNIAWMVRDQAHANQDRDLADLIAIMDHAFYGTEKIVRKYHATLSSDGLRAADGSGTILPEKTFENVAEMSRNPFFIPSAYIDWSRPDKHTLWTESNSVTENVPLTIQFHSDAKQVELVLTDGETKLVADVVDGIAEIALTAEQAKAGQYTATAIGDKDSKSIEICGWTLNDALRHALSDNSALGHDVGTGICFTTPMMNYNSTTDPVRLYMDGKELAADLYDFDNKVEVNGEIVPQSGYLQPYGATLILYEGTDAFAVPQGGKVVFSIRNAKLEALQGFSIAMDIELEKYDPNGGNGKVRQRLRPTYNTLTAQTPVWQPDLLQNTPKSGLPAGEDRWPMLGNWISDYDENGNLKPVDEIRPLTSAKAESAYNAEITVAAADAEGATIAFSKPVNPKDFGVAINTVPGVSFQWADDAMSVRLVYDAPAEAGSSITAFVFRSVDAEGNMIGGPVQLELGF